MTGLRLLFSLFIALTAGWAFYDKNRLEERTRLHQLKPGRKTYLIEPLYLPLFMTIMLVVIALADGSAPIGEMVAGNFAALFLYISIYFTALLVLLPLLRRFISARACATLWLLPNLLYFTVYLELFNVEPLLVITLPRHWLAGLLIIWASGFVAVLLWQLLSHLRYRHFLLREAEPLTDAEILSQWNQAQWQHEVKRLIPLLYSQHTVTPVTIGCFELTMRLVLPRRYYSQNELDLIFRHELRHIQRCDSRTKAWLGFCTAMNWFNPLMWLARRHVADDLELSCDESVLADSDRETRKRYAELLLKNAGDGRGYTTCLSAAASSLRYRLRNVMIPRRRWSGSVLVGLYMLLLLLGSNHIVLAGSGGSVQELIFDRAPVGLTLDRVSTHRWHEQDALDFRSIYGWEEDALTAYLATLQVQPLYRLQHPKGRAQRLSVDYAETVNGELRSLTRFSLADGLLWANIPYDEYGDLFYLVEDAIDWDYLASLLDFEAENPDPAPEPPQLMLYFDADINPDDKPLHAMRRVISLSQYGEEQPLSPHLNDIGVGGISGFAATQVQLQFSYLPLDGYNIRVEALNDQESYRLSSQDLLDDTLSLAPYSALYTVSASFATTRETVYEVEFRFKVELPE